MTVTPRCTPAKQWLPIVLVFVGALPAIVDAAAEPAKAPPAKANILADHKLYKMEPGQEKEFVGTLRKGEKGGYYLELTAGKAVGREDLILYGDAGDPLAPYVGKKVRVFGKQVSGAVGMRTFQHTLPGRLEVIEDRKPTADEKQAEAAMLARMLETLPINEEDFQRKVDAVEKARKALAEANGRLAKEGWWTKFQEQDARVQALKAEFDAQFSVRDRTKGELAESKGAEKGRLEKQLAAQETELKKVNAALLAQQKNLDESMEYYRRAKRTELQPKEEALRRAQDELRKLTAEWDRFGKVTVEKAWFRNWPTIIDGFATPPAVHQLKLDDLPIEYKREPRRFEKNSKTEEK